MFDIRLSCGLWMTMVLAVWLSIAPPSPQGVEVMGFLQRTHYAPAGAEVPSGPRSTPEPRGSPLLMGPAGPPVRWTYGVRLLLRGVRLTAVSVYTALTMDTGVCPFRRLGRPPMSDLAVCPGPGCLGVGVCGAGPEDLAGPVLPAVPTVGPVGIRVWKNDPAADSMQWTVELRSASPQPRLAFPVSDGGHCGLPANVES